MWDRTWLGLPGRGTGSGSLPPGTPRSPSLGTEETTTTVSSGITHRYTMLTLCFIIALHMLAPNYFITSVIKWQKTFITLIILRRFWRQPRSLVVFVCRHFAKYIKCGSIMSRTHMGMEFCGIKSN